VGSGPIQTPACILKPAERLVDNTKVGNIQGQVSATLVATAGCTPGVYLYSGTVTAPEDMNSAAPTTDTSQPLASAAPVATSQPPYYYQFTFLPPGSYTLAFTCQAALDNPDQADTAVKFTLTPIKTGITVVAPTDDDSRYSVILPRARLRPADAGHKSSMVR